MLSSDIFQSKHEWTQYREEVYHSNAVIDLEFSQDSLESAKKIKDAVLRKGDLKTIQIALAYFCFSIISVAFPTHPILTQETRIDYDAFEDIDTLFVTLNDAVMYNESSESAEIGSSRYTNDPDFYISMQNPFFNAVVKTEPTDSDFDTIKVKTSTPADSVNSSDSSMNSEGNNSLEGYPSQFSSGMTTRSFTSKSLSESPFDKIETQL